MADRLTVGNLPEFTVSFGLASSDQAADFQQVVSLADEALLSAKAGGRNKTVVARPSGGSSDEERNGSVIELPLPGEMAQESPATAHPLPKVAETLTAMGDAASLVKPLGTTCGS